MLALHFFHEADSPTKSSEIGERLTSALRDTVAGAPRLPDLSGAVAVSSPPVGYRARQEEKGGTSPPETGDGGQLLFHGFIDNREELLASLGVRGEPAGQSDAWLYAAAYDAWGDACDLKVVGQYAAVTWYPNRRIARMVRSPFRAPPLHIWNDRARAVVASSAQLVFACGVERRLDEQKIADSLFLNYGDAERDWFAGLKRLPTGCHGWLARDGLTTKAYWDIAKVRPVRFARDEDYVEAATDLFRQSTRAALNGFSRPAISLSGGFDSQGVASFVLGELNGDQELLGLTGVPEAGWQAVDGPGGFDDESKHVQALAAIYEHLEVAFIDSKGLGFDHRLAEMFRLAGSPPRNAINLTWIHALRAQARERDRDLLLTGDSGNLTFSFNGAGALPHWLMTGNLSALWHEIAATYSPGHRLRGMWTQAIRPSLPPRMVSFYDCLRGRERPDPFESWCPMNREWADRMEVRRRSRELGLGSDFAKPTSTSMVRSLAPAGGGNESGDLQQAFEVLYGLPIRDPTSWRPLVEFCAGIPDEQYLKGGVTRRLARRMLVGKVPEQVLAERRRGRQAADWPLRLARERSVLVAELEELAEDPAMAERFNIPRLHSALVEWDGRPPQAGSPQAATLVSAIPRALTTARFIRFAQSGEGI